MENKVYDDKKLTKATSAVIIDNFLKQHLLITTSGEMIIRDCKELEPSELRAIRNCIAAGFFEKDKFGNFNPNEAITQTEHERRLATAKIITENPTNQEITGAGKTITEISTRANNQYPEPIHKLTYIIK